MRLVLISDTHQQHFSLELPEGDVLIHAGDATGQGSDVALRKFGNWMRAQPHKHKVVIAGNHDLMLERRPHTASGYFKGMHYLNETGVTIDGIRFWGTPYSPRFFDWAFQCERGEDCRARWAKIPENTDVVISHGPPYGCGDLCPDIDTLGKLVHVGCPELLARIDAIKPKLVVCGHVHEGYGTHTTPGGVRVVNAASVDRSYKLVHAPITIDL